MIWLWVLVAFLVILGSILAIAEASLTRMTRVRALALSRRAPQRRRPRTSESDPPRFLNAIYLTVMLCQNGSAIIVAIIAEQTYGGLGSRSSRSCFTLLYFVLVEAMSKTFACCIRTARRSWSRRSCGRSAGSSRYRPRR